jgi:predicted 3-demethylubiquinone-9 3-methyltransferase (glyoxalase superfamily)
LGAGQGIAIREVPLKTGPCDYLLLVNRRPVGVIEAKKAGTTLSGVTEQSGHYAENLPDFFAIPCLGLNGGPIFPHTEAFSFQVATDDQAETDRYWNAIVGHSRQESQCGWCKDRWGLNWQITPRALTEALAAGGEEAKRAFAAMMEMGKIDVAKIEAARRG